MKFLEFLSEAEKNIMAIDHMLYVTYPLIKDKRLLIKILKEAKNSIFLCISAILQCEYIHKRIKLYDNSKRNFGTFVELSKKYGITKDEIKMILELNEAVNSYQNSSMEFYRNEKLVILSENFSQRLISIEKIKEFLNLAKGVFKKIKNVVILQE